MDQIVNQDQAAAPAHERRGGGMTIGVALGAGVARGWAHIGVMRALEARGVRPDVVAGASIGALVGGCWCAGVLDELEGWARAMTRRRMFSLLDIGLGGGGLIAGRRLTRQLTEALGDTQIETFASRFTAVACELTTGHEIWLRDGSVVDAMRASYALPGVFPPVRLDGRLLIDGALVNPVPVSVCRALGARLVIGVNLNAESTGAMTLDMPSAGDRDGDDDQQSMDACSINARRKQRQVARQLFGGSDQMPSITNTMLSALNIMQDRLCRSRLAGDPPDAQISPRLGHLSLVDFDKAEEMIPLGEQAVAAAWPSICRAIAILSA